jgi:hypothetical protein
VQTPPQKSHNLIIVGYFTLAKAMLGRPNLPIQFLGL